MSDFLRGCSRGLGIVAGFLPIAMSFGAIAIQSGLSDLETVAMSVWIFAGASQFAAVEAIRQQLPWFSVLLTVLIINLRHIPMSFAAQLIYRQFGPARQWLLSHGLVDETFALEFSEPMQPFPYYLGMHGLCWIAWVAGTWIGCQFGQVLPERWLQFALPALFLCLLVNSLRNRWQRSLAAVVAVGIAVVWLTKPLGATGILLAIIGVAIATSLATSPATPPTTPEN